MPSELSLRIRALRGQTIERRGERLVLLPQRAVWWPAQSLLVVADLHFGKAEAYRRLGAPVPDGMLDETLARLDALLAATDVQTLVVLGDLVHNRDGLTPEVIDRVAAWIDGTAARVTLVEGNHDRPLVGRRRAMPSAESIVPASWTVEIVGASMEIEPLRFVHEPSVARGRYTFAGHLHPTIRLRGRGDAMRLPCFHLGPRIGVLPAFTPFSRGVAVIADEGDAVIAIAEGELHPIGGLDSNPSARFDGLTTGDDGEEPTATGDLGAS